MFRGCSAEPPTLRCRPNLLSESHLFNSVVPFIYDSPAALTLLFPRSGEVFTCSTSDAPQNVSGAFGMARHQHSRVPCQFKRTQVRRQNRLIAVKVHRIPNAIFGVGVAKTPLQSRPSSWHLMPNGSKLRLPKYAKTKSS